MYTGRVRTATDDFFNWLIATAESVLRSSIKLANSSCNTRALIRDSWRNRTVVAVSARAKTSASDAAHVVIDCRFDCQKTNDVLPDS